MAALPVGGWGAAGAPGATGPAGPAPSGTGLVSVTDGVLDTPSTLAARVAADATQVRASLGFGVNPVVQLGSALTWTTDNGSIAGGSATAVAGTITLTHNANLTSGWYATLYQGPSARATFAPTNPTRWQITARVSWSGGANTGTRIGFGLRTSATLNRLIHVIPTSGTFTSFNSGASNYNPAGGGPAIGNSTGWVRLTRDRGTLYYEVGTGVGSAEPTSWTLLWTDLFNYFLAASSNTSATELGTELVCEFWQPLTAPVTPPVAVWDNINVRDLW